MMPRRPFTPAEHIATGARLWAIHQELITIAQAVRAAYGIAAGERVLRLNQRLARVRSDLDAKVSAEYPMSVQQLHGVPITRIYYGAAATDRTPSSTNDVAAPRRGVVHDASTTSCNIVRLSERGRGSVPSD